VARASRPWAFQKRTTSSEAKAVRLWFSSGLLYTLPPTSYTLVLKCHDIGYTEKCHDIGYSND
jgi:hypothetical protein